MRQRIQRQSVLAIAVVLVGAWCATALGQGTIFTYQGQLQNGGVPANGAYSMTYRVFDADIDGTQIGADVVFPAIDVANGLFTAPLDFGAGIFDGTPRWLEIEVNAVVLAPRQALTATPYAQKALTADLCNVANFANGPWLVSGSDLYFVDGNVGIGTSTPTAKLELGGTPGVDGLKFPDGTLQTTAAIGGGGDSIWSLSGADVYYNAGNVGIGTATPLSKVDITAIGDGAELLRLSTERPWVFRQNGTGSGSGLQLKSTVGLKNFEVTTSGGINVATFSANDADPRVGIGTQSPASKLDIVGVGQNVELLRFTTERPWIFRQSLTGPSTGLELISTSGQKKFQISAVGGTPVATFLADDAAVEVGIGTSTPGATLDVNGTTRTKVLIITGADLAEKFPTSGGRAEPGMVMEIDPENPGQLRISRGAYNQRVAGIVSGAHDFPAGAILGNITGFEDAPPIALSGRVWTYCDAGSAAITPGDLLTTSDTPGYAMKAADRERSHGSVIGKAMGTLAKGQRGLVLVLVNLQ